MLLASALAISWTTTTRPNREPEHRMSATTPDGTRYQSAAYCTRTSRLELSFRDAIERHQDGRRVTVFPIGPNHYAIPASI